MKKVANKIKLSLFVKLVAIVFSLVTVTFSWFIFTKDGWINPFYTDVANAVNVTISSDLINWTDKLIISDGVEDYGNFTEFSGDGRHFYTPIIQNKNITGYYLQDHSDDESKPYVDIQTYIKTDSNIKLFLSPESSILPSDPNNKKDYIAGAVRVAIILENSKPIIWAPNSKTQYKNNGSVAKGDGEVEDKYQYVHENSINDEFATIDDIVTIDNTSKKEYGYYEDENIYFIWGDLNRFNNYISEITPIFTAENVVKELIVPINIRVWVEGTDREAVGSLVGGKVKMNLKFISKPINTKGGND